MSRLISTLLVLQAFCAAENLQYPLQDAGSMRKPNILFILTDDQDLHMESLEYMPFVKRHITDHGLTFQRHYCTVALCCPSRVSMWTGKAAHNTNVTDINPPYGGYPKFVSQGFNEAYLPIWMQKAGYGTYYVGKLFNAQTVTNYDAPHAAGWTGSEFLLDPYTYRYLNATIQRNHDKPTSYEGQYATDVLAEKAYGFLDDAIAQLKTDGQPFFLTVAPTAPHSDVNIREGLIDGNFTEKTNVQSPPIPAERHKHLFNDVVVPRTPHFNPDKPGGQSWIHRLPQQNQTNVDFNDHFYRSRLRSLQAVDEMVDSLVTRLDDAGVLDNTYVFYSTDNGYHIGQHRLQPGKQCAFEEDINIPFIVRGPGIAKAETTNLVTTHTDLAPTFLKLAGVTELDAFNLDGQTMPLFEWQQKADSAVAGGEHRLVPPRRTSEHVNVEMWGIIMSEGKYGSVLYPNHTYKALRVAGEEYNLLYIVWCGGEHELYDVNDDPYQMRNLWTEDLAAVVGVTENYSTPIPDIISTSTHYLVGEPYGALRSDTVALVRLVHRLDALMMVLKSCKGGQCTDPWRSLFPNGEVRILAEALEPAYDEYFAKSLTEVRFDRCEKGYIARSEGAFWDDRLAYGMVNEMAHM